MNDNDLGFDIELFGLLLRRERSNRYKRVDEFLKAVKDKTGQTISTDSYYKFEKGTMKPSIAELMAINITLFGRMNAPEFWRMIETAAPKSWNDIERDAEFDRIDRMTNGGFLS